MRRYFSNSLFTLLLFLALINEGLTQNTHSLKYFGLTIHPFGDSYAYLQPNKLDKNAHFVLNFGLLYEFEHFIRKDELSLKFATSILADCSNGWASANMFALKAHAIKTQKHRLGLAVGPLFYIRESWERFSSYENTSKFKTGNSALLGNIQYLYFWYGITIDYDVKISPKLDFSTTFTPGVPYVLTLAFGVKYWPTREFKKLKKERILRL